MELTLAPRLIKIENDLVERVKGEKISLTEKKVKRFTHSSLAWRGRWRKK
jgi:hypothetical protein